MNGYLRRDFFQVDGYTSFFDAQLFEGLLQTQSDAGISGSMAEIGVHHGRSFFILTKARHQSERALAVDVFEDDALYQDPHGFGRGVRFKQNCHRLGVALADNEIYTGLSSTLDAAEIKRRVGPVRFFSVDGGHRYDDVSYDLRLAAAAIASRGIIVADDFMNPQWPEVTLAVTHWLRERGNPMAPFLCTPSKLYLCRRSEKSFYQEGAKRLFAMIGGTVREAELFEDDYLFARASARGKLGAMIREQIARLSLHPASPPRPPAALPEAETPLSKAA